MYDELQVFLDLSTTPERKSTLVRADQVLKQVGVNTHEDLLIDIIERTGQGELATTVNYVEETYRDTLAEVLARYDIWTVDLPNITVMSELLAMLDSLNSYDDVAGILSIVDDEDDACVLLGRIMLEVSTVTVEDVLMTIDSVGVSLMTNIRTVLSSEDENDDVAEAKDLREVRTRLRWFVDNRSWLMVKKGLDEGMSLGTPFDSWVTKYQDELGDRPYHRLVPELIAFAVAAGLSLEESHSVVVAELESLVQDTLDLTKADILTSKVLEEVFA